MRKIVIILGSFFGVILLALAALVVFFPKQKVLTLVQTKATEATKSPVKLADVSVSLSPFGLKLKGFQMGEKAEVGKPLVKVEELRVGVKLLPLLKKKVEISEIYVGSPYLEMLQAKPTDEEAPEGAPKSKNPNAADEYALTLDRLQIEKGEVHIKSHDGRPFLDLTNVSEKLSASLQGAEKVDLKGTLKIGQMAFYLPAGTLGKGIELQLDKKLSYNLQSKQLHIDQADLRLGDLAVSVEGDFSNADAENPAFDVKLHGGPTNVKSILGYLPNEMFPEIAGLSSQGILSIEGWAKGTPKKPDYNVELKLKDGTLKYPKLPTAVSGIQIDVKATPVLITINQFQASTGKTSLSVAGTVQTPQKSPLFALMVKAKADIAELMAMQPTQQSAQASGNLDLSADISGTQKAPIVKGALQIANLHYVDPASGLPAFTKGKGTLILGAHDFDVKGLGGVFGKSDFSVDGKLYDLMGFIQEPDPKKKALRFDVKLQSQHLDLDELSAMGGKKEKKEKGKVDTSVLNPYSGSLNIGAKEVIYNAMNIRNVQGRAELKRGVFDLQQFILNVFGGEVKLNGMADYREISSPKFDVKLAMKDIDSKEALGYAKGLNQFGKLAGYLSGKVTTNLMMKGSLKEDFSLDLPSLYSKGDISLANATFTGHPIQSSLSSFLGTEKLKSFEIKHWLQPFELKEGALHISNMKLAAKDFEVKVDGKQQIDGSSNFGLDLVLPPSMSAGIKNKISPEAAAILFDGSNSNINVPLGLTGSISNPKVSLNSEKLTAGVKDRLNAKLHTETAKLQSKVKDEAKQQVGKAIEKQLGAPAGQKKTAAKQKVQDEIKKKTGGDAKKILKKLF